MVAELLTLGYHKKMVKAMFGEGPALDFLNKKIEESPNGEDEKVIAPESQMVALLGQMQFGGGEGGEEA